MVDLFFDHFLVVEWDAWSDEPLDSWLIRMRAIVDAHNSLLPHRLQGLVPVIFEELTPSYLEVEGLGHALERMSRRVSRPNPLAGGERELAVHYAGLRDDFRRFLPAASKFVADYLAALFRERKALGQS